MSDYKSHGNAPIEFCGDQEGWIAVGSLSDDSPNSPCFPRVVLIGVGLGPSGKMHPSNIAAMLTIEQATDLRERIAAAMGHPAPVDPAAEIARLTAELAAARAVPADVEAALSGAWADGYDEGRADALRRPEDHHRKKPSTRDATIAWGKAAIARAISDATAARGTVGGLLATEPVGKVTP